MAIASIKELVEAGVHFGHRVSRWNPKMAPYIFGKRNLIHIINLKETIKGLIRSTRFLAKVAARGEDVLLVGTKRQARASVEAHAKRCDMPYVTERWLGGTLTNFRTITSRVKRLEELEDLEQSGRIQLYSKKVIASLQREMRKMRRNLEGIRNMKKLPGVVIVVDPRHEKIAVAEARKLDIPVVALADTDSDPDVVDIITPGNDDAIRSIQLYVGRMADAVLEGKKSAPRVTAKRAAPAKEEQARPAEQPSAGAGRPRRGRRPTGRRGGAARATQRLPGGKVETTERPTPGRKGGRRGPRRKAEAEKKPAEAEAAKPEAAESAAPEKEAKAVVPKAEPAPEQKASETEPKPKAAEPAAAEETAPTEATSPAEEHKPAPAAEAETEKTES